MRYTLMSPWFLPQLLFWLTAALTFLRFGMLQFDLSLHRSVAVWPWLLACFASGGQFLLVIAPTTTTAKYLSVSVTVIWWGAILGWLWQWRQTSKGKSSRLKVTDVSPLLLDPLLMLNASGIVVYSNMPLEWEQAVLPLRKSEKEWLVGEQTFILRELPLQQKGIPLGCLIVLQDISHEKALFQEWTLKSTELQAIQQQLQEAFRADEALLLAEQQKLLAEQLQMEIQKKLDELLLLSDTDMLNQANDGQNETLQTLAHGLRELLQQIRRLVHGGMSHDAYSNSR